MRFGLTGEVDRVRARIDCASEKGSPGAGRLLGAQHRRWIRSGAAGRHRMHPDEEDAEVLNALLARLPRYRRLTPTERDEALRMAQGLGCSESADRTRMPAETVRECRRRIYMKLRISGMGELLVTLLDAAVRMQRVGHDRADEHVQAAAAVVDRYKGTPAGDLRSRTAS